MSLAITVLTPTATLHVTLGLIGKKHAALSLEKENKKPTARNTQDVFTMANGMGEGDHYTRLLRIHNDVAAEEPGCSQSRS